MRLTSALVIALVATAMACGPSVDNGGDDDTPGDGDAGVSPDAYQGPLGQITGRVWMPNQAPGVAAPGEEIPVFGALVYLTTVRPDPIPQQVYCERCEDAPSSAQYTTHDGSFSLAAVPGTYWLVIQKGQFRLEQQVTVTDGQQLTLTDAQTTLPSQHDPDNGAWIPRIAVALGTNDNIEDVIGKIGLGAFDTGTNALTSGGGEIDLYDNGYNDLPGMVGTVSALFSNLDTMRQYHIIFFPCSTQMSSVPELQNETYLRNIRQYVNEGGKLYVTDWSGETMDRPFPPQIQLGDSGTDTVGTYDPQALTGTISTLGDADGSSYTSYDAEAVDPDLNAWLGLQTGPTPDNPTPSLFNPDAFTVSGNWNWIAALETVQTGEDNEGLPIYDEPKAWVIGSGAYSAPPGKLPLSVTFEPTGCGRVMFSTYQTANGHHVGLYPQERVLLFLIMEIGVCSDVPIVE